jgi:hypothetical protein
VLLCRHHNHDVVRRHDRIIEVVNGRPQFIPPARVDPERTPPTNLLHHAA